MQNYIHSFVEFSKMILSHGGYWIVFVVSMAEALPLVGSIVPGHTIVIIAGFLAQIGILNVWQVLLIASIGAIAGDIIGYELGKKYGYAFLEKHGHRFFIKPAHIEKAKDVMRAHTGKALILGRFNPVTRAFTPYLAGAGDVDKKRFWLFNIVGGVLWAAVSVLIGYVFGASYEVASRYFGKFIFLAFVISILIIVGYRYVNKRRHVFAKYHFFTLVINIASLYVFFKTLEDSFNAESTLAPLDVWVNLKMVVLQNPWMVGIMTWVTNLFTPLNMIIVSLLLVLFLAYKKRTYHALLFASVLLVSTALTSLTKHLVERMRPENALLVETGFSFPSGHAAISIVFFCALFYVFYRDIGNRFIREIVGSIAIIAFIIVGFTRVYLNVHWFSDVVGGFALGLFILTGLVLVFRVGIAKR